MIHLKCFTQCKVCCRFSKDTAFGAIKINIGDIFINTKFCHTAKYLKKNPFIGITLVIFLWFPFTIFDDAINEISGRVMLMSFLFCKFDVRYIKLLHKCSE